MPQLKPVCLSDDEYDKFREICKSLDRCPYTIQKGCILLGMRNLKKLKGEVEKIKPKKRFISSRMLPSGKIVVKQ